MKKQKNLSIKEAMKKLGPKPTSSNIVNMDRRFRGIDSGMPTTSQSQTRV